MGQTGALVLATCSGNVTRGPNCPVRERINEGDQIDWHWPILPEDHPEYDRATAVPRQWRVLIEKQGEEEWAKRMEKEGQPVVDPNAARYEGQELETNRGFSQEDARIVREAVDSLLDGDDAHWTTRGLPAVEQVAQLVEKYVSEASDPPAPLKWPEWVTRKVIQQASQRTRKSG